MASGQPPVGWDSGLRNQFKVALAPVAGDEVPQAALGLMSLPTCRSDSEAFCLLGSSHPSGTRASSASLSNLRSSTPPGFGFIGRS